MGGEQQIWTILRVCVLTFIFPRRNMEGFSVVNDIGLIQTDLSQSGSYGPGNGQASPGISVGAEYRSSNVTIKDFLSLSSLIP